MTLIDPAAEDWRAKSDSLVWYAAQDGIPQAQAELRRREATHHSTGIDVRHGTPPPHHPH